MATEELDESTRLQQSAGTSGSEVVDFAQLEAIQDHIRKDKSTAEAVIVSAGNELKESTILIGEDITGAPTVARTFAAWKSGQRHAMEALRRSLYFCKVEAQLSHPNNRVEHQKYLVTKARVGLGLNDDDWMVVSWTSPITAELLGRAVGYQFEFQAGLNSPRLRIEIGNSAKYGAILPYILDTTYTLGPGDVYVADERTLASGTAALQQTAPEISYAAAQDFGLSEIIELADVTQREAMHLPFRESVLVDGPPGSGKTSIGLMRIPCLIDRQWSELGLRQSKDPPFHEARTMRVLVLNEEMVDYLDKLMRSVGVHDVPIRTLEAFCQQICRDARTLSGRRVRESAHLTRLKLHPLALRAYWAGMRMNSRKFWERFGASLSRALESRGREFGRALFLRLGRWFQSVEAAKDPETAFPDAINLAHVLRAWRDDCSRLSREFKSETQRERASEIVTNLQRFSIRLASRIFDRHRIIRSARTGDEFRNLCAAALDGDHVATIVAEWMNQAASRQVSEADYVQTAWLATFVSYVSRDNDRQGLGFVKRPLTHVMVDEAQDVSPCHLAVIRRLLHKDGTITLVGDLRQRLSLHAYFDDWQDLAIGPIKRAEFKVNHRQSQSLGDYVRGLHACLFGDPPRWRASTRTGPLPRVRRQRGNAGLAEAVAEEVRFWRAEIPNATVGILFHGKKWDGIRNLRARVERALEDTLTSVYLAAGEGRAHFLGRTDCAILATVRGTKGLEFDAVVVIDPQRVWRRPLDEIPTPWRNAMYVSTSRAKQGLSLLIDDRSVLAAGGISSSLFESVVPKEGE